MKQNVDYPLQLQHTSNINSEYVFARPYGIMPFRGSDALKESVCNADLKYKDRIKLLQHYGNKIEELSDVETEEEAMYQREPNGEDGHSKTKKKDFRIW
ncbi:hypothetical protein KUTeg_005803 [Tegillarca granosa]|uniref:Uncharacterized protein n=1 Tax=Tegillarca granosa TaxID=220873 RepID=A0ABQ9EQU5_TEGGR|nr:hypothetical protein KUTeg_014858 [Tegillarca granosa]KAJ8316650.1 hypothetical protein KUTeg_005803 [Tegillarca granosa]